MLPLVAGEVEPPQNLIPYFDYHHILLSKSPAIDALHIVGDDSGHTDRVRNPVLVCGVLPDDLRQTKE